MSKQVERALKKHTEDMEESFDMFSTTTVMLFFVTFLVINRLGGRLYFAMFPCDDDRKHSNEATSLRLLWDMIQMFVRQPINVSKYHSSHGRRLLVFSYGLALFWLIMLFNCLFKTDLTVKEQPIIIRDIHDLLLSEKRPAFDMTASFWIRFKTAPRGSLFRRVWDKVESYPKYEVLYGSKAIKELKSILDHPGFMAIMAPQIPIKAAFGVSCGMGQTEFVNSLTQGDPIASVEFISGSLYSKNVVETPELRQRIELTSMRMLELGWTYDLEVRTSHHAANYVQQLLASTLQEHEFYKCIGIYKADKTDDQVPQVKISNMVMLLRDICVVYVVAMVVMFCERLSQKQAYKEAKGTFVRKHVKRKKRNSKIERPRRLTFPLKEYQEESFEFVYVNKVETTLSYPVIREAWS